MNFEIGTDIVSIPRISKTIERFGIGFLERFLLPSEILLAHRSDVELRVQFLCDIDSNIYNPYLDLSACNNCNKHIKMHMSQFFTQENADKYARATNNILKTLKQNFLSSTYRMETLAGFWAAKEACSKALGTGIGMSFRFHDMCILKDSNGKPHIAIHESKWHDFGIKKISISISHDTQIAISVCAITLP